MRGSLAPPRQPVVRYCGDRLCWVSQIRYLGVDLGAKLIFVPLVRDLRRKVNSFAGQLRSVTKREWGLKRRAVSTLYRGVLFRGLPLKKKLN